MAQVKHFHIGEVLVETAMQTEAEELGIVMVDAAVQTEAVLVTPCRDPDCGHAGQRGFGVHLGGLSLQRR